MYKFLVTFFDEGNCEIFQTEVEVSCFSDAIEKAFFQAGQSAADGNKGAWSVLVETNRITVEK